MLAALFTPAIISAIFHEGAGAFAEYQRGKITLAQLQAKLKTIAMQEATKVEKSNNEALVQTYHSFTVAMGNSRLVRWVWAIVTLSQLAVLLWHQVGVPLVVLECACVYPSSGDLIKWAYALLAFCLGGGPIIMKTSASAPAPPARIPAA